MYRRGQQCWVTVEVLDLYAITQDLRQQVNNSRGFETVAHLLDAQGVYLDVTYKVHKGDTFRTDLQADLRVMVRSESPSNYRSTVDNHLDVIEIESLKTAISVMHKRHSHLLTAKAGAIEIRNNNNARLFDIAKRKKTGKIADITVLNNGKVHLQLTDLPYQKAVDILKLLA